MQILTHLTYRASAKKCVISNDIVTVLKAYGKRALADVNCDCKTTSIVALDGVTSFLGLKDVTYSCKCMRHNPTFGGFLQYNGGKLGEAEDFKCVFVVYNSVRIEIDQL